MPDGSVAAEAKIGPNAILQLTAPVESALGPGAMNQLLGRCGVEMPSGIEMIPQGDVLRLHRALWSDLPDHALDLSIAAGRGTAAYIAANRIPPFARRLLRALPAPLAERALTKTIAKHAWTFCGSGHLSTARHGHVVEFSIQSNPLVDTSRDDPAQCHWHTAVFAELFSCLVARPYRAEEITCCGAGHHACTFHISPLK